MRPMNEPKLTGVLQHASSFGMQETNIAVGRKFLALSVGSLALWSCVTVEAPTEPIVIELNVNIRQEVIYRLAEDAGNTIEENSDIF